MRSASNIRRGCRGVGEVVRCLGFAGERDVAEPHRAGAAFRAGAGAIDVVGSPTTDAEGRSAVTGFSHVAPVLVVEAVTPEAVSWDFLVPGRSFQDECFSRLGFPQCTFVEDGRSVRVDHGLRTTVGE